jgi:hypothetical protein
VNKYKHKLIKDLDEYNEVIYCIYCGQKLSSKALQTRSSNRGMDLVKVCPYKCVKIIFLSKKDALSELEKELAIFELEDRDVPSRMKCDCKFPMLS